MYSGGEILQPQVLPQPQPSYRPSVVITEQPGPREIRFRYASEDRLEIIKGISSTPGHTTHPSIKILGYTGRARVVVSCVTKDYRHKPHPHELLGRGCKKGVCAMNIPIDTMSVTFDDLKVLCVGRKRVRAALLKREQLDVDPFKTGFKHREGSTKIDLKCIRLCFQVFIEDRRTGRCTLPLAPVVSEPFFDKKAVPDLAILKMCSCTATCAGSETLILICAKVCKEDIKIRFFEEQDGVLVWEGFGDFEPKEVFTGTAIAFRPPRYRSQIIEEPVNCYIQLVRPSTMDQSPPLPFQFIPSKERNIIGNKRRKLDKWLFPKFDEATNFITEPLPHNEYVHPSPPLPEAASSKIEEILLSSPTEELPHIHISSGELDHQLNSSDLGTGAITLSETFQNSLSLTDQNIDKNFADLVFESTTYTNLYMME